MWQTGRLLDEERAVVNDVSNGWSDTMWLPSIEADAARILDLVRDGDLTTPVEHLSRWRVRDVVAHLGGVHRWATRIVTEGSMAGPGFRKSKLDGDDLCDWFEEGAADLLKVLRSKRPQDPCPNFNPGSDRTVEWWARRQTHETMVHRWDIEAAVSEPIAAPPAQAADGVDEFLDVFVRTRGKQTLESTMVITITDPTRSWTLRPAAKPGRIDVVAGRPDPEHEIAVEVSGTASSLLLALWGRLTAQDAELTIDGDSTVATSLFPT